MKINWESQETVVLINPRFHVRLVDDLPDLPGHLWLMTSGSTAKAQGHHKWAALSKMALLKSAQAVNQHLRSTSKDVWLNPLPDFHVGGLGIWARAYLSGAKVYPSNEDKWNPQQFVQRLQIHQVTLTSLVPTQVYDLIQNDIRAPTQLRGVIVGGGALPGDHYQKALELGWPLIVSYGMTECCSQVATARVGEQNLHFLSHVQGRINAEGLLEIKSDSLLTTYALQSPEGVTLHDPKNEGWFTTSDRAEINKGILKISGRADQIVKIGGECVNLATLELRLQEIKSELQGQDEYVLIANPDERLQNIIQLYTDDQDSERAKKVMEHFNAQVLPFERIRSIQIVSKIPKTPLGKIQKQLLKRY